MYRQPPVQACRCVCCLYFRRFAKFSFSDLNISRWLEAHSDRSSNLTVLPRNLVLADVSSDGDHRLVLTDLKIETEHKSRLKVYRGTVLTSDQTLPDLPSGVISFYTDEIEPKIPGK